MNLEFVAQPDDRRSSGDREMIALLSRSPSLRGAGEEEVGVGITRLFPVFSLLVRSLGRGAGLEAASLMCWRCFVIKRDSAVASVDFQALGERGVGEIVALNESGASIENTMGALGVAEAGGPDAGTFEICLLLVQGIYFQALWLRERSSGQNLLIPIPPCNSRFAPRIYEEDEFLPLLRDEASKRLMFSRSL